MANSSPTCCRCDLTLLFWLSLMPFATAWMGENHFTAMPLAGSDFKGKVSLASYLFAISLVLVAMLAGIWFIPDSRIEKRLQQE